MTKIYFLNFIAKCGKVLAGWLANSSGEYLGGYPPTMDMIVTKKQEFVAFAEKLFYGDNYTAKNVKLFLTCSLIFYYDDLIQVIKECPNKKYDPVKKHPIINEIFNALRDVKCVEVDLLSWKVQLQKGFKERNFNHL